MRNRNYLYDDGFEMRLHNRRIWVMQREDGYYIRIYKFWPGVWHAGKFDRSFMLVAVKKWGFITLIRFKLTTEAMDALFEGYAEYKTLKHSLMS